MIKVELNFRWDAYFLFIFLTASGLLVQPVYAQTGELIFAQQGGTPIGIKNFILPENGCDWLGIGGQVFDQLGNPLTGLVIKLEGSLEGQPILQYAVTGGYQQFGPGGFLVTLADHPVSSDGGLFLQVLDVGGGEISPRLGFLTYDECDKNLILLNVSESLVQNTEYLPLIQR